MSTGLERDSDHEGDDGENSDDGSARTAAVDFTAIWTALADADALDCRSSDEDLAYWREHADSYGERFPDGSDPSPEALETIRSVVSEDDSVLELGPGTGRYTAEIAPLVDRMTAVDYSEAMLERLHGRLGSADITSVDAVHGRWPAVGVDPHDVVVTAWTMYSQRDVAAALEALVRATRKTLIVVDGTGASPPHSRMLAEIRGDGQPERVPRHLLLAGVLEQMDVHAALEVEPAVRERTGPTPEAIAERLAGPEGDDGTVSELAERLEPALDRTVGDECDRVSSGGDKRWRYRYEIPAGVLCWHRSETGRNAERSRPLESERRGPIA